MENIHARFILEIMGRPKEHLMQSLNELLEAIKKEKDVKVLNIETKEPVAVKDTENLFVTFSEVEAEFMNVESLLTCVFKYMPGHFEIISPEQIRIRNSELNSIVGGLIERLHNYEGLTRKLVEDQHNFIRKLESMGINLFADPNQTKKEQEKEEKKSNS